MQLAKAFAIGKYLRLDLQMMEASVTAKERLGMRRLHSP